MKKGFLAPSAYSAEPQPNRMQGIFAYDCPGCGLQQIVRSYELDRRSAPRCAECGGPLIETTETAGYLAAHLTAAIGIRHVKKPSQSEKRSIRCKACGLPFANCQALARHLSSRTPCEIRCFREYITERRVVRVGEQQILLHTLFAPDEKESLDGRWCVVKGVTTEGTLLTLARYEVLAKCHELISKYQS